MDTRLIVLLSIVVLVVAVAFAQRRPGSGLLEALVGSQWQRCGVDLPPCPAPLRCANGGCIAQEGTMPIESYPLPVLPPR
jgi:hypothetical protein